MLPQGISGFVNSLTKIASDPWEDEVLGFNVSLYVILSLYSLTTDITLPHRVTLLILTLSHQSRYLTV